MGVELNPCNVCVQEVAASFHAAMRPEEYLAHNEQLWNAMHTMLAPQAPAPLRRLPYPFRAGMLALLSTELPHLVAPVAADGGRAVGTGEGVEHVAIALYSVSWPELAAPAAWSPGGQWLAVQPAGASGVAVLAVRAALSTLALLVSEPLGGAVGERSWRG
eukprot:scaffold34012_cov72-Phaeocystis_antarctica.AAC.1